MKKEQYDWIKKDGKLLGIALIITIIIFKIVYYKEAISSIVMFALSIFWVFLIPGFLVMSVWREKFNYLERIIMGLALGAAIMPLISYLLALINIHLKISTYILPLLIIIICTVMMYKKHNKTP